MCVNVKKSIESVMHLFDWLVRLTCDANWKFVEIILKRQISSMNEAIRFIIHFLSGFELPFRAVYGIFTVSTQPLTHKHIQAHIHKHRHKYTRTHTQTNIPVWSKKAVWRDLKAKFAISARWCILITSSPVRTSECRMLNIVTGYCIALKRRHWWNTKDE